LINLVGRFERVRAGTLEHADRCRWLVVEEASQRVDAGAKLDASDIAQPRDLSVRCSAYDDVAELLFGREPSLRVDQELERVVGRRRRRAQHTGCHLNVLLAYRLHHVGRRQTPRREPVRIEPDAHAVLAAAEHLNIADAGDAPKLVAHLQMRVVRQIEHVVALIRRHEMDHHQEVWIGLLGRDADALDFDRQPRQRLRDAVLHLHLRVVRIGAERKRDGERQRAIGRRLREHVQHPFDAVDLLLER
jgi:hypothetical protein